MEKVMRGSEGRVVQGVEGSGILWEDSLREEMVR